MRFREAKMGQNPLKVGLGVSAHPIPVSHPKVVRESCSWKTRQQSIMASLP